MSQEIKEEIPSHRIKSFLDVELEEQSWGFAAVKLPCQVSDIHEIIMDTSLLYKNALGILD